MATNRRVQQHFGGSVRPARESGMKIRRTLAVTGALIAFTLAVGTGARADTILNYHFDAGSTFNLGGGNDYAATGTFSFDVTTSQVTAVAYSTVQIGSGPPGPYNFNSATTNPPTDTEITFTGDCCGDVDTYLFAESLALGGTDAIVGAESDSYSVGYSGSVSVSTTPLPSTWTMLIAGFVGLGFFAYRGSKKGAAALA
jgi:hypothetical protein